MMSADVIKPDPALTDEDIRLLRECRMCPRECGANRFEMRGVCRADAGLEVSSVNLHFGEEPPISGYRGSGTVFLTNCNMRCVYCQNYPISQLGVGRRYSIYHLAEAMVSLQRRGAHNINLVTPSHYVVQIRRAVILARRMGLTIPIVYNTSGYDCPAALEILSDVVDIFMPDLRYYDPEPAAKFSGAPDYPEVSRRAVKIMHSMVGDLVINSAGVAERGLLIRLLVLPENLSGTDKTLRWIAENLGTNTYISLMSQYFPAYKAHNYPPLDRRITPQEYQKILDVVEKLNFERGYIQPMNL